ncbi:FxSxx-COOH system tetratricopeptide repeat protein [Streptomyces sp. NPDC051217]|uniref:FxSxx-COOH system tetratricopeptide repeat protein n=1 Tax=Streptomyces sp. NPDC051217 TaxID=3365644 RepID=UPI003799C0CA
MTAQEHPATWNSASGERSIAAGFIQAAITGDVLPAESLYTPKRVEAAPGTSNLPEPGLCLGRGEELAELRRMLAGQGEGAITQSGAVHGLGGIGKTTLATHYAHHYLRLGDYRLVWWINAVSPDTIEQSLASLTHRLVPDWAGGASGPPAVAWAMQWLAWHPNWLLVYDNVEDPQDLTPYTGALRGGHHLATSRRTAGWPDNAPTLTLGNLNPGDATDLLCRLAFKGREATTRERADAAALVAELGYLPLALKQASAYLARNRGITIDSYLRRLPSKLDKTAPGVGAERTIARVWQLTLHALEREDQLAVAVLHTAAWLSPEGIPHTLLTPPGTDPDDIAEAIGTLASYSMVTDTGTTMSVHRLVQAVLRTPRTNPTAEQTGRTSAEQAVLHALTPPADQDEATDSQWDTFTPHLIALAVATPPDYHDDTPLTDAYNTATEHLHRHGHIVRALPLVEATLAQRERALGNVHPDTLSSRNDLAYIYQEAGELDQAILLFEAALTESERVLGDTHPGTLITRNNLAGAYQTAGDLNRAIPLYEATLTQFERVLGDTHPDTLASRNNLASAYQTAGDLNRAIPLYEATLTQRKQIFGDTHPHTLASRNNLASAYQTAGDLNRAIPLYEATLTESERVLGHTHPDTLITRNNLASAYQTAGDLNRAIPLCEATLTQREQILGDTHPSTLTSRNNLASAYRSAGDLDRAIALYEATLTQREQILGDTHPDTLITRNNLARAYGASPSEPLNLTGDADVAGDDSNRW